MAKPATLDGYRDQYTLDCERVLVTLLRGLGPWKDSVYLVGGRRAARRAVRWRRENGAPRRARQQLPE
jgi:hypothetical protein